MEMPKPVPFLATEFNEGQARFSPDGHRVAYTSDETGEDRVYLRSFAMGAGGRLMETSSRWPVSERLWA
jgi:Tol biopolymer transport system component